MTENNLAVQNGKRIAELIARGIEAWLEAGKVLVETLEQGVTLDQLSETTRLSKGTLVQFEQIGRGTLYPRLLIRSGASPGARALLRCGRSEQEQYCAEPLQLLVLRGEHQDVLRVPLDSLTPDQCKQIFSGSHIRDLGEQRAYLESQAEVLRVKRAAAIHDQAGYTIKGNQVLFQKSTSLGRDDLIQILSRMR
jgi:hypothetical protein